MFGWFFIKSVWKRRGLHNQITLKSCTSVKFNFKIVDLGNEIVISNLCNNLFSIETAMPFQFYVMCKYRRDYSYSCTCNCF